MEPSQSHHTSPSSLGQNPLASATVPASAASTGILGPLAEVQYFNSARSLPIEIAEQLAGLYQGIYGCRYISPLYSDPKRICAEISEGRWHACVGFGCDGKVAGQVGAMLRADGTLELGRDVVDPSARMKGSYRQLVLSREHYIQQLTSTLGLNIDYQWAESVTGHLGSQRTYQNTLGFTPCGLGALKYPDVFGRGQRESVVLMVRLMSPAILSERPVYLPFSLREISKGIFDALECQRLFAPYPVNPTGLERTPFVTKIQTEVGQISFDFATKSSGVTREAAIIPDVIAALRQDQAVQHLSAKLNLQDPLTPMLVELLEVEGFVFGHIEPHLQADVLVLQRPLSDSKLAIELIDERMCGIREAIETRRAQIGS